ncbi:hypothetical protein LNP24_03010 [Klebsiella pneumoniae subsp. pneumoniae]|nr:hypothetical protein [Klebsiella pneumoniae subsp. pneumoniae]
MSTNERKTSGAFEWSEGKLSDAERMKLESNYLRGTIAEDLNDGLTGGFKGDNFLLIRFPGMYQQDDRDIRARSAPPEAGAASCDAAPLPVCRAGMITTTQWKAIDKFAAENTIYGSIRLTNRADLSVPRHSEKERQAGASDAALGGAGRAGHRQRYEP